MALTAEEKTKVNPGLSAVLSFLVNGLGQIYNGQIRKGLMLITMSVVFIVLILVGAVLVLHCIFVLRVFGSSELILGSILMVAGIALSAVLGVYNIYDAYNVAKKKLAE